mmetsp:Transcript_15253/g.36540  ORF Transcript_15253/g.36540 Transcript_15253/m.36540 type:complete len:263 (+) Transcript_15253:1007-1795(+)
MLAQRSLKIVRARASVGLAMSSISSSGERFSPSAASAARRRAGRLASSSLCHAASTSAFTTAFTLPMRSSTCCSESLASRSIHLLAISFSSRPTFFDARSPAIIFRLETAGCTLACARAKLAPSPCGRAYIAHPLAVTPSSSQLKTTGFSSSSSTGAAFRLCSRPSASPPCPPPVREPLCSCFSCRLTGGPRRLLDGSCTSTRRKKAPPTGARSRSSSGSIAISSTQCTVSSARTAPSAATSSPPPSAASLAFRACSAVSKA